MQLQNLVEAEWHGKASGTGLEPRTRIREDCRAVPEYRRTRETGEQSRAVDAKPGELSMGRLKRG